MSLRGREERPNPHTAFWTEKFYTDIGKDNEATALFFGSERDRAPLYVADVDDLKTENRRMRDS